MLRSLAALALLVAAVPASAFPIGIYIGGGRPYRPAYRPAYRPVVVVRPGHYHGPRYYTPGVVVAPGYPAPVYAPGYAVPVAPVAPVAPVGYAVPPGYAPVAPAGYAPVTPAGYAPVTPAGYAPLPPAPVPAPVYAPR